MNKRPHIAIVGAGFGGLWAARELAKSDVRVTLIDRNNYHAFLPLLYQVAAAEIEPEQIAYPVRSILRKHDNVDFMLASVTGVDFEGKTLYTKEKEIEFDYIILALGSKHHYFNVPGAAKHAFPLKTIQHSVRLRHQILRCFEAAAIEEDPEIRRQLLSFAIVGGGPTGVEYAGALSELIRRPLKKDYPSINFDEVRVILVEGTSQLLGMFPEKLGTYTQKRLEKMGVEIIYDSFVSEVTDTSVKLHTGVEFSAETVVWTAGVKGETLAERWHLPTAGAGQVAIQNTLQVPDLPHVFAIGDMAYLEQDGEMLPMLAQNAMQQGEHAAANIVKLMEGKPLNDYRYRDLGAMATIGRNSAVAEIGKLTFTGFIAWSLWIGVHISSLIGFRNRLFVLTNWAWDYFFFERVARLILHNEITVPVDEPEQAYM